MNWGLPTNTEALRWYGVWRLRIRGRSGDILESLRAPEFQILHLISPCHYMLLLPSTSPVAAIKLMTAMLVAVMALALGSALAFAADDGKITVTNATAGQEYNAYLMFPASPSDPDDLSAGVTYTATATQIAVSGFDGIFDTIENENGDYTITVKDSVTEDQVVAFVKANKDALAQGSAIAGTFVDNSTVEFDGLAYGYYYITSSLGTLISVDTAGKTVTVVDKNESTPTGPDKVITDEDSSINEALDQTDQELTENDSAVGSVESFKVTFNATNWQQEDDEQVAGSGDQADKHKILVWKFKDTPTNLAIDETTVKVFVNGADVTGTITDLAVNATTGALTFNIPWVEDPSDATSDFLYETQTEGSALIPVLVTYDAEILAEAASSPAPNTVEVTYNRDDEQDVELGEDTTTTYTYKFLLEKVDENDDALEGAEFQLVYAGTETPLTFTMEGDKYRYDPEGTVTNIAPVGDPATAEIIGLDNADYTLKEVVVPEGYTQAADTDVTGLVKEDGQSEASATTITVENEKGSVLPSTGGMGTTILYTVGAILVIGAVVLLITRRRMNNEK